MDKDYFPVFKHHILYASDRGYIHLDILPLLFKLLLQGDLKDKDAIFVRDQLPSAQLRFDMENENGPQVVLDGSSTYTVHFLPAVGSWTRFSVPGLER